MTTDNMQELTADDLTGVAGGKDKVSGGWDIKQNAVAGGGGGPDGPTLTDVAQQLATLILTAGLVH